MKIINLSMILIATSLLTVIQVCLKYWLIKRNVVVWPINIQFFESIFFYRDISGGCISCD